MMAIHGTQDRLVHTINVLQQLQRLMPASATLEDVDDLLACIEAQYGAEILLEDIIQSLVGEHLAAQIASRQPYQYQFKHTEVAA